MPKIRIKGPGGVNVKVEVPTSASFGQLNLAVGNQLNLLPGFQLSLNKQVRLEVDWTETKLEHCIVTRLTLLPVGQTPLQVNENDSLAAAGICAGDLLWVLHSSSAGPSPAATTSEISSQPSYPAAAALAPSSSEIAKTEAASNSRETDPTQIPDVVVMADAHQEPEQQTSPAGGSEGFRDILYKIIHVHGSPPNASGRLIAAVHAAMLKRSFQPLWISQVGFKILDID